MMVSIPLCARQPKAAMFGSIAEICSLCWRSGCLGGGRVALGRDDRPLPQTQQEIDQHTNGGVPPRAIAEHSLAQSCVS